MAWLDQILILFFRLLRSPIDRLSILCALRLLASKPKTERKGGIELKDRLRAEKDRRDKEANKGEKRDQNRGNG